MKKVSIIIVSLFVIFFVLARLGFSKVGGGFGGIQISGLYPSGIPDLNTRLFSLGYNQSFSEVLPGVGGFGFGIMNKVVISGFGVKVLPITIEGKFNNTNVSATIDGGMGFFEVGYALLSDNFSLIPMLGIGGGGYLLNFKSKTDAMDFDNVARSPLSYNNTVNYGGCAIELSVLFLGKINLSERKFKWNEKDVNGYTSVGLSLKLSYLFLILDNDVTIINEPIIGQHNLLIGLSIFFGGGSESE
ncbi:MAG: hypothetical protein ACK4F9_03420 [Brevinematia bacterium]